MTSELKNLSLKNANRKIYINLELAVKYVLSDFGCKFENGYS